MIGDIACLGICLVDPATGVCQGCGRGPEEVSAAAQSNPLGVLAAHPKNGSTPLSAVQYPLPPQVAHQLDAAGD